MIQRFAVNFLLIPEKRGTEEAGTEKTVVVPMKICYNGENTMRSVAIFFWPLSDGVNDQ
jgi:hypothetical protein